MPRGRLYGLGGKVYGTAATAMLMEEKPSNTGASECKVWKMDIEHYNRTGEVRKLEYLREEHIQKLSCHRKGAHFIWDKEGQA